MKFVQILSLTILGAGLLACSSYYKAGVKTERYKVDQSASDVAMDSLIAPYRRTLNAEMSRVIGSTAYDLAVERPNSTMGQWVADVIWKYGIDSVIGSHDTLLPVIALFNTGGLRASIAAGNILVGDIYKVMPFDNMITAVKLPIERLDDIQKYILDKGGEPVSNLRVSKASAEFFGGQPDARYFWVVTSDFLANGGDKMYFFTEPAERIDSPMLIRNLLLREVVSKSIISVRKEERVSTD